MGSFLLLIFLDIDLVTIVSPIMPVYSTAKMGKHSLRPEGTQLSNSPSCQPSLMLRMYERFEDDMSMITCYKIL